MLLATRHDGALMCTAGATTAAVAQKKAACARQPGLAGCLSELNYWYIICQLLHPLNDLC